MIFTIGFIVAFIGWFIVNALGEPYLFRQNKYDYIGASLFCVGMSCMLFSVFTLAWEYLP